MLLTEPLIGVATTSNGDIDESHDKIKYWDKRAFEHFHVYCWSIKDTAWIRAMDWRIVVTLGTIVVTLSAPYMFIDACAMATTRCHVKRIMYFKEFVSSVIQFIWIFGSVIWATGECYDLRTNAGYLDIYTYYLAISRWFIAPAVVIGAVLWSIIIVCNIYPYPTWYNSILDDWYTVYHRKPLYEEDSPVYLSHDTHSDLQELEDLAAQEGGREVSVIQARDDIIAIPRVVPGIIRVPSGHMNYKTGLTSSESTWQYTNGLFSYREIELLLLYVWVCKDYGWSLQDFGDTGKNMVVVFGILALLLGFCSALWVLMYSKQAAEKIHAVGVFLWITGDMVWCFGEFYLDENPFPEKFSDPKSNADYILPPLFTSISDLPPGSWFTRYIGAWILVLNDIMLTSYYIYIIGKKINRHLMRQSILVKD